MKIIVACDKFKGSLFSAQANAAVAAGIRRVEPDAEIVTFEVADGGDGTAEAVTKALQGYLASCFVTDPLGRQIVASYGIVDDIAVIDVAQACGLTLLADDDRNPLIATTYGVGQMIIDAYEHGCRQFIIGLGGTATCDGGTGMLRCLGLRFTDENGCEIGNNVADLRRLVAVDTTRLRTDICKCHFTVLSDVTNPLCGQQGAARVFGPQKGADSHDVETLEEAMQRLADVVYSDIHTCAGTGAAGGLGAAFLAYTNAGMQSGADTVLDIIKFDEALTDADLVITGEGCLDAQSLRGKLPVTICRRARAAGIPTVAIAGCVKDGEQLQDAGFAAIYTLTNPGDDRAHAMLPDVATANLTIAASKAIKTYASS